MNRYAQTLMLGIVFMAILSLAVNSTYAAQPMRGTWDGIQYQGQPFSDFSVDIKYRGKVMIVKISGIRMVTFSGYDFDDVHVVYERIDDLTFIMTPRGIPYPLENPLELMYLYPHHGKITWYDDQDSIVGTGTFGSRGGNMGSLVVNGPALHVEGGYGLWVDTDPKLVGHQGWFIKK